MLPLNYLAADTELASVETYESANVHMVAAVHANNALIVYIFYYIYRT